jgi:4-hydroxybenzoate polyprenyltransferase
MLAGRYNSGTESPLLVLFILLGALMGSAYSINQIVDLQGDDRNNKLFHISNGHVKRNAAMVIAVILAVAGIIGLFSLGLTFGLIGLIFIFITGFMYNLEPFLWKDKPLEGVLTTVVAGFLVFLLGCLPEFNFVLIWKSLPYLTAFGAVALLTSIPDMEGDKYIGKLTFVLKYGIRTTLIFSALLCLISALLGWWTQDRLIFWPAALSLPVFIYAAFKQNRESVILTVKVSILLLSLAVGFRYLLYLLLIVAYFFFARWYYRERFNFEYPSFKVD